MPVQLAKRQGGPEWRQSTALRHSTTIWNIDKVDTWHIPTLRRRAPQFLLICGEVGGGRPCALGRLCVCVCLPATATVHAFCASSNLVQLQPWVLEEGTICASPFRADLNKYSLQSYRAIWMSKTLSKKQDFSYFSVCVQSQGRSSSKRRYVHANVLRPIRWPECPKFEGSYRKPRAEYDVSWLSSWDGAGYLHAGMSELFV